jgi:hypothetical protein
MKNPLIQIIIFTALFLSSSISKSQIASVEIKNNWIHLNTTDSMYAEDEKERRTKIYFNEDDQKKIIQLADSFSFWEMPDTIKAEKNADVQPCPGITMIHIKTKEHDKTVTFDCTFENDSERYKIRGLEFAIFDIVYKKTEYLALPRRHFFHE